MGYFLDQDLRKGKTYISHTNKFDGFRLLIECEKVYQARELLRALNAGITKGPIESPDLYQELEPLPGLEKVRLFRKIAQN